MFNNLSYAARLGFRHTVPDMAAGSWCGSPSRAPASASEKRGFEGRSQALSAEGNPEYSTVMKVIRALKLRLHAESVPG